MVKKTDRKMERARRHLRVRRKISGTKRENFGFNAGASADDDAVHP